LILLVVRHGLAEVRAPGLRDEDRALTREGKRRTKKAMRGLIALGERPRVLLSSPLRRAWQTAEILARELGRGTRPRVERALVPGADLEELLARLREESAESVAIVGHEPELSTLVRTLAGSIELKKAGVARVDGSPEPGGGRIAWVATPLLLRRAAR
jgi:phosphohistidine phosphatase